MSREMELLFQASRTSPLLHEAAVAVEADLRRLTEERDALAEQQPFPVETVMAWKRRAEGAEAIIRYARLLLDPDRQDEPDEENVLRAYEALSGFPLSVDPSSKDNSWFIPEGDRTCGVVHKMARATCMKRRGHDGSHATPQGTWIDGPWCEYPADSQPEETT